MSKRKRRVLWVLAALSILLIWRVWAVLGPSGDHFELTLGPTTTVIDAPLDSQGLPDYLAYINQRASEGVTPDNNAAPELMRILGPREVPPEMRQQFFAGLGMEVLPEKGDYYVQEKEFAESLSPADVQVLRASIPAERLKNFVLPVDSPEDLYDLHSSATTKQPWAAADFPYVERWLDRNEEHLNRVVAAAQKPRFYAPFLAKDVQLPMMSVTIEYYYSIKSLRTGLNVRALRHIHSGQVEQALADAWAIHHLSRLVDQVPFLQYNLTSHIIEHDAVKLDNTILQSGKCTRAIIAKYDAQLKTLPTLSRFSDRNNDVDRLIALDTALSFIRQYADTANSGFRATIERRAFLQSMDINEVLCEINRAFDNIHQAFTQPSGPARDQAFAALVAWRRTLDSKYVPQIGPAIVESLIPFRPWTGARSRKWGQTLLATCLPSYEMGPKHEIRATAYQRLAQISIALALYRADHGEYPPELAKLTPDYLPAVPVDPYSDQPFHYLPTLAGYLLYSVGPDRIDDQGREFGDVNDRDTDDIALKIFAVESARP